MLIESVLDGGGQAIMFKYNSSPAVLSYLGLICHFIDSTRKKNVRKIVDILSTSKMVKQIETQNEGFETAVEMRNQLVLFCEVGN